MSNVTHQLQTTCVRCHVDLPSRKRALELAAELTAQDGATLSTDALLDGMMERERLGSTGLGDGVAIPHCRFDCEQMRVAFITLKAPVDFEANDGQPVDILFAIVVPTDENEAHLHALATLSAIFADPANRDALRRCASDGELLSCLQHLSEDGQNSQTA